MRALTHATFGEATDVLEVTELPLPEPGPGEVRVRTVLATIHNHDLWTIRGTYGYKPDLPAASGTEAVGVVDALGEGVTTLQVGQRVVAGSFGVWAEYFVAKAAGLVPVPDGISDETAAQLVAMPFSALSLLDYLDVSPGDWIVQNTASPLAAVDSVGGSSAADLAGLLGEGGTLVSFGAMGAGDLQIPSGALIFKDITVKGFWGSRVSRQMDAAKRSALFAELFERIGSGEVELPVEAVYPFEEARAAAAASDVPGRVGKILLRF